MIWESGSVTSVAEELGIAQTIMSLALKAFRTREKQLSEGFVVVVHEQPPNHMTAILPYRREGANDWEKSQNTFDGLPEAGYGVYGGRRCTNVVHIHSNEMHVKCVCAINICLSETLLSVVTGIQELDRWAMRGTCALCTRAALAWLATLFARRI